MPVQRLNVAASDYDLDLGGNITTGTVDIGFGLTSGELGLGTGTARTGSVDIGNTLSTGNIGLRTSTGQIDIGPTQTSGVLNLGTSASRTGIIAIGNAANTGDINIATTGDINASTAAGAGVKVLSTTASSSSSTGALVVSGGVGVAGQVHANNKIFLSTGLESNSASGNVGLYNNVTTGDVTIGANMSTGDLTIHRTGQTGNIVCNTDVQMAASLTFTNKGTVTQATSVTTAVTLNAPVGIITSFSGTYVAGALYSYTFTNSFITTSSVILLSIQGQDSVGPNTMLQVHSDNISNGSCTIWIGNPYVANWTGSYLLHFLIL